MWYGRDRYRFFDFGIFVGIIILFAKYQRNCFSSSLFFFCRNKTLLPLSLYVRVIRTLSLSFSCLSLCSSLAFFIINSPSQLPSLLVIFIIYAGNIDPRQTRPRHTLSLAGTDKDKLKWTITFLWGIKKWPTLVTWLTYDLKCV